MKHLFIINPAAGGRDRTAAVSEEVRAILGHTGGDYEIYVTRGPMDACEKIRAEAETEPALRVYACGGDGTLNECVCASAEQENVAVTHYPTGTGNDFVKTFGADRERFRDLAALVYGETRPMDAVDCNGRRSINICSVGIDARIGTDVHKYSRAPLLKGSSAYIASLAVNLAKGVKNSLRVVCNGRLYYGEMSLVCCCNGSYYGGGFHPVPQARPDDGVLDFLLVRGVSRLTFLRLVGKYAQGRYAEAPRQITYVRSDAMEIDSDRELVVNVDGEAVYGRHVSLRLLPRAVNFIVPRGMAYFA